MRSKTSITMFSAGNGDAFLINHAASDNTSILIDGGYAYTFHKDIHPQLKALHETKGSIDLMITTHIDSDHIAGLIALIAANENSKSPKVMAIDNVWHNSLRCMGSISASAGSLSASDITLLKEIRLRGYAISNSEESSEISALQGSSLGNLLIQGEYHWNEGYGNEPIIAGKDYVIGKECKIKIIAPTVNRIEALRDWWLDEIRRIGFTSSTSWSPLVQDAFEFISSYDRSVTGFSGEEISSIGPQNRRLEDIYEPDTSITNGSSIAFILSTDTRRILFLGDTWAEEAVKGLENFSNLDLPCVFDVIKISHHGSFRNTSPELLKIIDSPRYLISTNGHKHCHPDIEVLKAIVDRPANFIRHIYFNYKTASSDHMEAYSKKASFPFCVHVANNIQISLEDDS